MATNNELKAQVVIYNFLTRNDGSFAPKVLSIKASRLLDYVNQLRNEANTRDDPKRAEKFSYLPLLCVIDAIETKEEVFFQTEKDLPKESVFNSKGTPLLIIIPEDDKREVGLNRTDVVPKKNRDQMNKVIENVEPRKKILAA